MLLMREKGMAYQAICDIFNSEGVPTPAGSPRWWRSHVSRLLHTRSAFEMSRALRVRTEAVPTRPGMHGLVLEAALHLGSSDR